MNWKERLLAVFSGEKPDVMPWFADLGYWRPVQDMEGKLPDKWKGVEGLVRMHKDLNVGLFLGAPSVVGGYFKDIEIIESIERKARDKKTTLQITTRIYSTPLGDLRETWRYRDDTYSSAPIEYPVKRPEDLKILRYIAEHQEYESNYDDYLYYCDLWDGQGIPVCMIPRTPLAALVLGWAGITNASYLQIDAPDEFAKTIECLGETQDKLYEIVAKSPAKFVEIGENLSGEVLGGTLFRRYALEYYKKRVKQLHEANKIVGTHLDGTLRGVLPLLAETEIDFVESITPAPVGDVEIEDLRALSGDMILWGGIPGAMFCQPFTKDYLKTYVKRIVDTFQEAGKFVLGTADQVPPNGDITYVSYISELLERH